MPGSGERRLVRRYPINPPIPIRWNTSVTPQRGWPHRNWFRRREAPEAGADAHIADLSVVGALVLSDDPPSAHPKIGSLVEFTRDGVRGVVRVRRVVAHDSGSTEIGVEFIEISKAIPDLDEIIVRLGHRPPDLVQLWERDR